MNKNSIYVERRETNVPGVKLLYVHGEMDGVSMRDEGERRQRIESLSPPTKESKEFPRRRRSMKCWSETVDRDSDGSSKLWRSKKSLTWFVFALDGPIVLESEDCVDWDRSGRTDENLHRTRIPFEMSRWHRRPRHSFALDSVHWPPKIRHVVVVGRSTRRIRPWEDSLRIEAVDSPSSEDLRQRFGQLKNATPRIDRRSDSRPRSNRNSLFSLAERRTLLPVRDVTIDSLLRSVERTLSLGF